MKNKNFIYLLINLLLFQFKPNAEVIRVEPSLGFIGEIVSVPIMVDKSIDISAASFTIRFDTNIFRIHSVESEFFESFTDQWSVFISDPELFPDEVFSFVGLEYFQPLICSEYMGEILISGARVDGGSTNKTLCTLHLEVLENAVEGETRIGIEPTVIFDSTFGYSSSGEEIPLLVGSLLAEEDLAAAYPVIPASLQDGTVTIEAKADLPIRFLELFPNAEWRAKDIYNTWIGNLHIGSYPWVWSYEAGWLYIYENTIKAQSFWCYDDAIQSFSWQSASNYPWQYFFTEEAADWYWYYKEGSPENRWYWNVSQQRLFHQSEM